MESLPEDAFNYSKWRTLFELMSTERSEQFLPRIGLTLKTVEPIRQCARRFIENYDRDLKKRGKDLSRDAVLHDWWHSLLHQTFDCIEQSSDPPTSRGFLRWAGESFHYNDRYEQEAGIWNGLLKALVGMSPIKVTPLQLPPQTLQAINQEVTRYLRDEEWPLTDKVNQVDAQPILGWDEYLYRFHQSDVPVEISPLDSLSHMIAQWFTREVWRSLRSALTPDEIKTLVEWGRGQTNSLVDLQALPD